MPWCSCNMNKVIRQTSNSSRSNIISKKTKLEKVILQNTCFSFKNMEMNQWWDAKWDWYNGFLIDEKHFLAFLDILEEIRVKLPEFGGHQTEFGGVCIVRTQDSRKSMFFTWIMNKSLCKSFLGEIRPWSTFTSHNQPSPEIWFETEHSEILSFSGPKLKVSSITSWAWNGSREQFSWILEIFQV